MARRDPDAWRHRAKKEPARRWFLKAFGWTVVGLSNLGGAISFVERFWVPRSTPAPAAAHTVIALEPARISIRGAALVITEGKAAGVATASAEGAAIVTGTPAGPPASEA